MHAHALSHRATSEPTSSNVTYIQGCNWTPHGKENIQATLLSKATACLPKNLTFLTLTASFPHYRGHPYNRQLSTEATAAQHLPHVTLSGVTCKKLAQRTAATNGHNRGSAHLPSKVRSLKLEKNSSHQVRMLWLVIAIVSHLRSFGRSS